MKTPVRNLIGAAVALLALSGCTQKNDSDAPSANPAASAKGECHKVNECKGKGECGGTGHSCAGENACKGQGWITLTVDECKKRGGEFKGS